MDKPKLGISGLTRILFDSRLGADLVLKFKEKEELVHSLFFKLKFPNVSLKELEKHEFYLFEVLEVGLELDDDSILNILEYLYDLKEINQILDHKTLPFFIKMDYIKLVEPKLDVTDHKLHRSDRYKSEHFTYHSTNDFFINHEQFCPIKSLKIIYETNTHKGLSETVIFEFRLFMEFGNIKLFRDHEDYFFIDPDVMKDGDILFEVKMNPNIILGTNITRLKYIIFCLEKMIDLIPKSEKELKFHIEKCQTLANRLDVISRKRH